MEINIIKKIIALLEESNLKKIHLRDGDFEISLEKDSSEKKGPSVYKEKRKSKEIEKEVEKRERDDNDYVLSPMVGTYYASSAPDQSQFVKVGDAVNEDTVICIIEAMKVMNEIKAGKKGVIKEILVDNASPVEFGTKLFVIQS